MFAHNFSSQRRMFACYSSRDGPSHEVYCGGGVRYHSPSISADLGRLLIHASSVAWEFGSRSKNSSPIPTFGFTERTTASISTFRPLCVSVPRTLAPIFSGRRTQTRQPPAEISEVTPQTP